MSARLEALLRRNETCLKPNQAELIVHPKRPDEVLYPGAHIATGENGTIFHHGIVIDTSDEMTIVHFWGENKSRSTIQTTTLNAFLASHPALVGIKCRPLFLIHYLDDTNEKRRDTVHNAKFMLSQTDQEVYNLISNNCEVLATSCRTGRRESAQIEQVKQLLVKELDNLIKSYTPKPDYSITGYVIENLFTTVEALISLQTASQKSCC